MKPERFFYTGSGALFLVLTGLGFLKYITAGKHVDGTPIEAQMSATVLVHSASVLAWYVLFFVQSLLISVQSRGQRPRVHRPMLAGLILKF